MTTEANRDGPTWRCRTGQNGRDGLTWKDMFLINEQTENIRQWFSLPRSRLRGWGGGNTSPLKMTAWEATSDINTNNKILPIYLRLFVCLKYWAPSCSSFAYSLSFTDISALS